MPQWKPPIDSNLPSVPIAGTQLSPHQKWVAKQLTEMKDLTARQQAWLDAAKRNKGGLPGDPRNTVPKATASQAAQAMGQVGAAGIAEPPSHGMPERPPMRPLPSQTPPSSPSSASSTRQNSMGVRRRRKVTEEEEEEFDANSQAHHPGDAPPSQPPPPPPSTYEGDGLGDGDGDDDDDDPFGEDEPQEEPEVERPRDRMYPPPRGIQPYDHRTDVMIEKFGQVANQMIYVVKENNFMAQQSALESRKAADMIRENANSLLKAMQESSTAMVKTFQENATKMMEMSVRMVEQADKRRDSAETAQLAAMETYQNALTREAQAEIAIAQANAAIEQVNAQGEGEQPADDEPEAENETEGLIAGLVGKGMANAAGPLLDQVVQGVMGALGANGPKLNQESVENIVQATVRSMMEQRRKNQTTPPPPTQPKS